MDLEIGAIMEGKVTGITNFGAFVSLPMGRAGLVHISEVAHSYVNDIREHLTEGQEVKVKVLAIDGNGRVNLSIKKAVPPPVAPRPVGDRRRPPARVGGDSFEDKLKAFMQDSDSKVSGQFADHRSSRRGRGGGGKKSKDF